jgi:hypothetical protein
MALRSTQPLTEMSTRNLPGGKGMLVRKADNLTAICEPIVLETVGASTSHNTMGLHGLVQGELYLLYFTFTGISLRSLLSTYFPICCSLIVLSFPSIRSQLLTELLNKP